MPGTTVQLLAYDCIVFVNVPVGAFDSVQLEAVHDAVYNVGVGFIMVGGANSFGPGGYHRTVVEKALPVRMDIEQRKVMPKGALAVILHTCEFAQGNTIAKRITKQAIRVLSPQDDAGVLAYTMQGDGWVVPMTPASNFDTIVARVNSAQLGDMPDFGPTMKSALRAMKKNDASAKHVIIISDADPAPPLPATLEAYKAAKVTISCIAINPHNPADMQRMKAISDATGGKFYRDPPPGALPRIFIKEARTLKRSMIQNKTFTPVKRFPTDAIKGLDRLPPLHAYVLTSLKGGQARGVLMTPGADDGETPPDPVLAIWNYGLGKSAAFTSDLSANWARDWVDWNRYRQFVNQLVTQVSRSATDSKLDVQAYASGSEGVISVEDFSPGDRMLDLEALVSRPDGSQERVPLRQKSARRYGAEFPLGGSGLYQVVVEARDGERAERSVGGFSVPYSAEYLRFTASPAVLKRVAEETGGRVLSSRAEAEEVFLREDVVRHNTSPVFDWFLIALAFLLPLDVAARRVQIDWSRLMPGRRRGPVESTTTMGALLRKKKSISMARREESERKRPDREKRPRQGRKPPDERPPERKEPPQPPDKSPEDMSTTERLLRMKRNLEREDDE
jgi:uncharacterized membrane protein